MTASLFAKPYNCNARPSRTTRCTAFLSVILPQFSPLASPPLPLKPNPSRLIGSLRRGRRVRMLVSTVRRATSTRLSATVLQSQRHDENHVHNRIREFRVFRRR